MNARSVLSLTLLLCWSAAQAGGAGAPIQRPVPTIQAAAPDGRALLQKAIQGNGGQALRQLRTVQQSVTLTYLDAEGQAVLTLDGSMALDLNKRWVTVDFSQEGKSVNAQYLNSEGAFGFTPQSGTVPLPREETQTLLSSLYFGPLGLHYGEQGRDSVKHKGPQTWLNLDSGPLQGTALEVVTQGMKTTYLLDASGLVIAERYVVPSLGELITVYRDVKTVNGIPVAHTLLYYTPDGKLAIQNKVLRTQINPPLNPQVFQAPR